MTSTPQVTYSQEIGLRLPNGTEIWPPQQWHGRDLDTVEGRENILNTLRSSTVNLGMDEPELLDRYAWVTRNRTTVTHETTVSWTEEGLDMPIEATGFISGIEIPEEEPARDRVNGETVLGQTVPNVSSAD